MSTTRIAITVAVLLLAPQTVQTRPLRELLVGAAFTLGSVVGVIGLRWHYFTDTDADAAVGIGMVCGLALILDLPTLRRQLDRADRYLPGASGPGTPGSGER